MLLACFWHFTVGTPCSQSVILLSLISKKRVIIMRQRKRILLVCFQHQLTLIYRSYCHTALKSKRSELDDGIKRIERDLEKIHLPQVRTCTILVHVPCYTTINMGAEKMVATWQLPLKISTAAAATATAICITKWRRSGATLTYKLMAEVLENFPLLIFTIEILREL